MSQYIDTDLQASAMQLGAAKAELAGLRDEVRLNGSAAHKSRKRAAADCEAAVQEYDSVLSEKEVQHQREKTALRKLQEQMEVRIILADNSSCFVAHWILFG